MSTDPQSGLMSQIHTRFRSSKGYNKSHHPARPQRLHFLLRQTVHAVPAFSACTWWDIWCNLKCSEPLWCPDQRSSSEVVLRPLDDAMVSVAGSRVLMAAFVLICAIEPRYPRIFYPPSHPFVGATLPIYCWVQPNRRGELGLAI